MKKYGIYEIIMKFKMVGYEPITCDIQEFIMDGKDFALYKAATSDKNFDKTYPYWAVWVDVYGNKRGLYISENHFGYMRPFVRKVDDGKREEEDHTGMIQGYDGEWKWL